jgi:hypothetical protein
MQRQRTNTLEWHEATYENLPLIRLFAGQTAAHRAVDRLRQSEELGKNPS